jgi:hypothetical protein
MWWGLFIGIVIGALQLMAVAKLGKMILSGNITMKVLGGVLFLAKIALLIFILYLLSTFALELVMWTAGGMLLGLTAASLYIYKRRGRA